LINKKDYEENDYTFQGKKIVAGDAAWVYLKGKEELENMEFFFNDSMYDEDPTTDSMLHIIKVKDGTYVIEMSVNFRGTWKSRNEDDA